MDLLSLILVAFDGAAPSNAALGLALRLAAPRHDLVRFVSVFERDAIVARCATDVMSGYAVGDDLDAAAATCESALYGANAAARVAGVDATPVMRTGLAVDAILDEARDWNASCIAIGTHGRKGLARVFLGSCAEGVLRKSPVPVLIGHALSAEGADGFGRILGAIDDSPAARGAFDTAAALAAEWDAELHLLSVVQVANEYTFGYEVEGFDPDGSIRAIYAHARATVMALAAEAIAHGTRVKPHVLGGSAVADRIVQVATMQRCGLIV